MLEGLESSGMYSLSNAEHRPISRQINTVKAYLVPVTQYTMSTFQQRIIRHAKSQTKQNKIKQTKKHSLKKQSKHQNQTQIHYMCWHDQISNLK